MSAFFIADIRIHDPQRYQAYLAGFMEIFERHGAKLRFISSAPVELIRGTWSPSGIVVMEFPTLAHPRAWKDDPDYQSLARIRQDTTETHMILVDGL